MYIKRMQLICTYMITVCTQWKNIRKDFIYLLTTKALVICFDGHSAGCYIGFVWIFVHSH